MLLLYNLKLIINNQNMFIHLIIRNMNGVKFTFSPTWETGVVDDTFWAEYDYEKYK